MNKYKRLFVVLVAVSMAACQNRGGGSSTSPKTTPPAHKNGQPPQPSGDQAQGKNAPAAPQIPGGEQESRFTHPEQQPAQPVPPPSAKQPSVAEVESSLPPIAAIDTYGGQLLTGYLSNSLTGEQVVNQVFDNDDYVLSNLAEMSLAVNELKHEGKYTPADRQKVQVLEGAMTEFMNKRVEYDKNLAQVIDYGSAAALGVLGGVYSDEVVNGLRNLTRWRVFSTPVNAVSAVYERLQGAASKITGWLGSKTSRVTEAVAESEPAAATVRTVKKSRNLYRRSMALWKTRGGRVTTREVVIRNVARVLASPELSRGYTVTQVADEDMASVRRLVYHKTGISGFRINQRRGSDYLVARVLNPQGDFEYFNVRGNAMKILTKNGEEMLVPRPTMTALIGSRLRNFGTGTLSFVTATGRKIKTGLSNSRAYAYATTNPMARRLVQGTAVGGTVGMLTLLALRPLDTSYLTIDDYVQDLADQGIHIEDFVDGQRAQVQRQSGINQNSTVKAE